jgi:hypothetical protein
MVFVHDFYFLDSPRPPLLLTNCCERVGGPIDSSLRGLGRRGHLVGSGYRNENDEATVEVVGLKNAEFTDRRERLQLLPEFVGYRPFGETECLFDTFRFRHADDRGADPAFSQ